MPVHDEIAELLRLPENGKGAPTLAVLEARLTDGYAEALALEAERLRIEQRLGEVARVARKPGSASELENLSQRLSHADGELARLRALLDTLQERARSVRGSR
ncbi:MAG TPA: hypothetical protein VE088_02020 [Gaiellaceae bacterium]|jgi:hypothetical protein|nr:hypothetical protein [Gaiellaceae bacterium]